MLLVSNIQRFTLHDGPGIRTTVFLKGCPLSCPWCCNPENRTFSPQFYFQRQQCLRLKGADCSRCRPLLDASAVSDPSDLAGKCLLSCIPPGISERISCPSALGVWGRYYETAELCRLLLRDRAFFENSGGGVTISGGEPLAHPCDALAAELSNAGVHVAVETSLLVHSRILAALIGCVSLFIVDAKIMDSEECRKLLGGSVEAFLESLRQIASARKDIILRVPLVQGVTATQGNLNAIAAVINRFKIGKVQLFPLHHLGNEKVLYMAGQPFLGGAPSAADVDRIAREMALASDCQVEILRF